MLIRDIMSKPAVCCADTDNLHIAAQRMWECDVGAVPVVNDSGKLVGVVTDRDICMATYTKGQPPQSIRTGDVMSKLVFSCRADDSIDEAERLMGENQIRRLPIVDNENRPIGVLSLNDVARHAAVAKKKDGEERAVVQTMAAICQPRHDVGPMLTTSSSPRSHRPTVL